jgi:cellulose synthase (UDP-forming)
MEALRQFGGFPDHPAEDLLVSLGYRRAEWRGVFVPKVLATGLAPESWPAYLHQQFRWAFSVLDIKWHHLNVPSSLALVERSIAWIQGFGYLQDALMGVAALGFLTVRLSTGYGTLALDRLHAWEPLIGAAIFIAADAFRQKFYLLPEVERGLHWRAALLRAAKWPLALKALVTVTRHRRIQYRTTPKIGGGEGIAVALLAPHAVIALLVAGAWIAGMSQSKVEGFWPHFWTAAILLLSGGLAVSGLLGRRERNQL